MKTMYETISFDNLEKYRSFESIAEMDEKVYGYIEELRKDDQPESVIDTLLFLGRSSLRITGVSFAKYQTIADSIRKSKRTVIRAINTLVDYGMIERIATVKKWRKSVNVIVINAVMSQAMSPQHDTTTEAPEAKADKAETAENGTEPSLYNQFQKNYVLESAGNRNNIPKPLYNILSPFFDGKELRKYVGIVFRAKTAKVRIESHTDEFKTVILDVIRRYKTGSIQRLEGYLYAAIRKLSRELFLAR